MTTNGGTEALQEVILADQTVNDDEELESTVRAESEEIVAEHIVRDFMMDFPGHTLHKKGLQRQEGVGPLTGQQTGTKCVFRPAVKSLFNRGSTARQPLISFLHLFT